MVRRQILIQRGQVANDLDKRVREKLLASKIDVKQQYYAGLWKDEVSNLQNAPTKPKAAAAADATAATPAPAGDAAGTK